MTQLKINEYLTIGELCERLKLKKQYIKRLTSERKIPFRKIGHLVRYEWNQIEKWIEKQSREQGGLWQDCYLKLYPKEINNKKLSWNLEII